MTISKIYKGLWDAVDGICDKRYLKDRPKSVPVSERPDSYIVVSVPYRIKNNEIDFGGSYNDYTTNIRLEIYVRDKVSSKNPNEFNVLAMDEKVEKVMKLFPIITEDFIVSRPNITMQTGDGDGFAVTIIQGFLRTK